MNAFYVCKMLCEGGCPFGQHEPHRCEVHIEVVSHVAPKLLKFKQVGDRASPLRPDSLFVPPRYLIVELHFSTCSTYVVGVGRQSSDRVAWFIQPYMRTLHLIHWTGEAGRLPRSLSGGLKECRFFPSSMLLSRVLSFRDGALEEHLQELIKFVWKTAVVWFGWISLSIISVEEGERIIEPTREVGATLFVFLMGCTPVRPSVKQQQTSSVAKKG